MKWSKAGIFAIAAMVISGCSTDPFELDIRATELSAVAIGSTRASVHEVLQEPLTDETAAEVEYLYLAGRAGATPEDPMFSERGALEFHHFRNEVMPQQIGSLPSQVLDRWADIQKTHAVIKVSYDENDQVVAVEKKGVCGTDCPTPLKPPSLYKLFRGY